MNDWEYEFHVDYNGAKSSVQLIDVHEDAKGVDVEWLTEFTEDIRSLMGLMPVEFVKGGYYKVVTRRIGRESMALEILSILKVVYVGGEVYP